MLIDNFNYNYRLGAGSDLSIRKKNKYYITSENIEHLYLLTFDGT